MANPTIMNGTVIAKNNPWPKKTIMETLIERSVATTTRCYICGGLVYAMEKIKTANHIYHNGCFRCRICKRHLTGATLNEEGDEIYCTNCYRKKQRGDCQGLEFKRAAVEKAEYVHNRRHPDEPPSVINLRPPSLRDYSRHPSLTMRQLERHFLSHQEPNTKDFRKLSEDYRRLISVSHPVSLKTSFSVPAHLTKTRSYSSLTTDATSPELHFLPVFSPFSNTYSESTAPTPKTAGIFFEEKNNHLTNSIQPRLNHRSLDLKRAAATPPTEPKHSIIIDVNQKNENKDKKASIFLFPERVVTPIRRRSSSISHLFNPRKNSK